MKRMFKLYENTSSRFKLDVALLYFSIVKHV